MYQSEKTVVGDNDLKLYSLQETARVLSKYEGFKNLHKIRAILEYNRKYNAKIFGEGNARRFVITHDNLQKLIQDIENGIVT